MDSALKQRLIGAVVLVALAVIFLPMLIKGPAPDSGVSDVALDVPATPGGDYETRELPLVTPGAPPQGGVVGLGGTPQSVAPSKAPATPAPSDNSMLPATTAAGEYAVNFGAYATIADADAVIARIRQSGLPGYREPAIINGNTAYRVRIGPYADRADAESARLQGVRIRSDVKAQVVALDAASNTSAPNTSAPNLSTPTPASTTQPAAAAAAVTTAALPPEPAKPADSKPAEPAKTAAVLPPKPAATPPAAATPAATGIGFAVQLGAFSGVADANALRDKLRAGGFSAFVQQVQTDKGTLSRVRVGPVANRADADGLKSQVAAKLGLDGLVTPNP